MEQNQLLKDAAELPEGDSIWALVCLSDRTHSVQLRSTQTKLS